MKQFCVPFELKPLLTELQRNDRHDSDSRAAGNLWLNNHVVDEGNPPSHKILVLRQYKARHVCPAQTQSSGGEALDEG